MFASRTSAILAIIFCLSVGSLALGEEKLTAEEIVNRHLDSIANAATRAAMKSRVLEGTLQFRVLTGGAGQLDGRTAIVSEGNKTHLMMKIPSGNYQGERIITDGKKVKIASATEAQSRSNFGQFIYTQDIIVREGLLGGTLTTAWPLLNLKERHSKLSFEGLKSVNGSQLYEIQYKPQKGQDVTIHLYFDPESYHHVLTVYTLSISPQLVSGGDATQASGQQETRYRVEERFSNFKTIDGVTLPNDYQIHYTQETQAGKTTILEWQMSATQILENVSLDSRNFNVN